MKGNGFYTSSKFWIGALSLTAVTLVQLYAMQLGVEMPKEFLYFVGSVAFGFTGLKTYQNVALTNGNGGSK